MIKKGKHDNDKGQKAVDFKRPLPFWECAPIEYEDYMPLMELGGYLDSTLEQLFKTEIDSGNANVLDEIIDTYARRAFEDLAKQRQYHLTSIDDKVTQREGAEVRYRGAYRDAVKKLEEMMPEFKALEEDYMKSRKRRQYNERYQ